MTVTKEEPTRVGVIGWPVAHTVSPAMFNAAFAALEMDWHYEAFSVEPGDLAKRVRSLHECGLRGVNVTVPYKRAVIPLLDSVDIAARTVGAVNTITAFGGESCRLRGTNTDVHGFYDDLKDHLGPDEERPKRALVLGAGGAARAAVFVLTEKMGYQVSVAARDTAHGLALIRDVQTGAALSSETSSPSESTNWRLQTRVVPWDRIGQVAEWTTLIVNCTPVGMWPEVEESPWPEGVPIPPQALVYDLVYRPTRTRLLQQAEEAGALAVGGLGMLVRQGAASFKIWTGQEPPLDVMVEAARAALAENAEHKDEAQSTDETDTPDHEPL